MKGKNLVIFSIQNDMLPLSRSLPEGVVKADQLKDEGL